MAQVVLHYKKQDDVFPVCGTRGYIEPTYTSPYTDKESQLKLREKEPFVASGSIKQTTCTHCIQHLKEEEKER